jgi:hypothetical protein
MLFPEADACIFLKYITYLLVLVHAAKDSKFNPLKAEMDLDWFCN